MGSLQITQKTLIFLLISCFLDLGLATRKLSSLYQPPPLLVTYHKGALLDGDVPVSILWYGKFTSSQKSIISDLILSFDQMGPSITQPSVNQWWKTIDSYMQKAGKKKSKIMLSNQVSDENFSMGKILTRSQVQELALRASSRLGGPKVTLVLTDKDVAVEGFCMSHCGFHDSVTKAKNSAFIWVGDSVTHCPGQCAWPFHQPIYGPQTPPLVAPNGDVGLDGMAVNIASLLAGSVTNPFGDGFFQGEKGADLEVVSACPGVYGKGAYPGYAGELLVDASTGGSYNAHGVNGRKYLLPAMFDPSTSSCSTLV